MQEASLKKRYIIKLFANIISGVIGLITLAIVPKFLGPHLYGQFVYLQDFFMKVISFLDMGSSMAFFTKLSSQPERKELILFYFIYLIVILILIIISIFIINHLNLMDYFFPSISYSYIYLGLIFGILTWLTQIFIKISDAYVLTVSVEIIKIINKIFSLLLLLYLIYFTSFDLYKYFIFHYITLMSFLGIITWLFFKQDIFKNILSFPLPIIKLTKEFIEYCSPLVVYNIIVLLSGIFDIWLLQKFAGNEQTGFYGLSYSLAAVCLIFTSAMISIITREFAKFYEQKDFKNMRKLFFRYIPMLYSIAAYFAVFISFQSKNIIMIFANEQFKNAYLVLTIMALYPIHQTYGQLNGSIFYAIGQTKLIRNIALFTQSLGVIISFIFIYYLNLGAVGLGLKMVLIQFIAVNIQLYFNSKLLKLDMKYFIFHQIYSIIFFVIFAIISTYIVNFNSPLVNFLISGIFYTIFVIILIYIFPQVFSMNRNEIKEIIYKLKVKR